jgi:hypothetical protein
VSLEKGFPKRLLFLKGFIDSGKVSEIKFVLTLLNVSRSLKPSKEENIPIDYSSITQPSKVKLYTVPS